MKKIVLILIMAACSLIAAAQEQGEKQLVLKNGTTLTGIIEVQADGSYQLKTASGDILFFAPSEVERMIDNTTKEKIGKDTGPMNNGINVYRKGSNLRLSNTGELLKPTNFYDYASWNDYQVARSMRKWGIALTLSSVPLGVGAGMLLYAFTAMEEEVFIIGGVLGVTALVAGPLLLIKGTKNINAVANDLNQHPGYALEFGPQQHGVGFALKF